MAEESLERKITKILVVDDSVLIRRMVVDILKRQPGLEVVGEASNGKDALRLLHALSPHVVTLDVDMPVQDGFTTLKAIMEEKPTPVVMLSGLTQAGAQLTIKCLEAGAVDFVPKPLGPAQRDLSVVADELIKKVRCARLAHLIRSLCSKTKQVDQPGKKNEEELRLRPPVPYSGAGSNKIIAIGISTGGPSALREVFPYFPENSPPILVTQHMPVAFTGAFAERLNRMSKIKVKEAEENDEVKSGWAYLAPGGRHLVFKEQRGKRLLSLSDRPPYNGHRPSVDVMFESVVEHYGKRTVGVIMTGMGNDGAAGLKKIREAGGRTLAQNEESCVVYGMPKAAVELSAVEKVVSLEKITEEILRAVEASTL